MTPPFPAVLVTPNFLGADGVSSLSRQIAGVLGEDTLTLSLHDPESNADRICGAKGSRVRFVANVLRMAHRCDRHTIVVCTHVHLAPPARLLTWRGAAVTYVLCGIEAWVPLRPLERWALASGRLTAISRHTARRFIAANPAFTDASIDICHPGVRPPGDEPTGAASEPAALIVARMAANERYKGHDELLRIWPAVLACHSHAQLWIVGDGDDRPRLEALARALGVAARVTFTGRISDEALADRYRRCRFFVMPSPHEGFGLVFLEAMRAGKACIGASGAAAEIIEEGRTGLIVVPGSSDALYRAVVRMFDEPQTCDAFGRAGAARYRAEFTDARFADRFGRFLDLPPYTAPVAANRRVS